MEVKAKQLWQEADTRHIRVVRVLAVEGNVVTIITEMDTYKSKRKPHPTKARLDRFKDHPSASHCGYFLVKDVPIVDYKKIMGWSE
jgi:hypothetical protein